MNRFLSIAVLGALGLPLAAAEATTIGKHIDSFTLRDCRGAERSLNEIAGNKIAVVAFLGCECPLARAYGPRLAELASAYRDKNVVFIGINSNSQDAPSAVADYAKESHILFPMLKDAGNSVADRFGAARTPEVFVLDAERTVRYCGRIDDQFGIGFTSKKPEHCDLIHALDEVLAGKSVSVPSTPVAGCLIGRTHHEVKNQAITFHKQIQPLLQKHCVECHRTGEIGPFAMASYDEVSGWADMIDEVVSNGRMPPWNANPKYGHFKNERRLSDSEKQLIKDWVANGAPEGPVTPASNPLTPAPLPQGGEGRTALAVVQDQPVSFVAGWRMGKPDMVVPIPKAYAVPASGDVPYEFIAANPGFTEDRWVKAAEVRPGCRGVVHHVLVFVQPPGGGADKNGEFASNWLVAYVPGCSPMILPEGTAKHIPAGSRLMFQIHYTPNGAPATDQTSVGLIFARPEEVKHEIAVDMAANTRFAIPAGAANYKIESSSKMRQDELIYRLMPHTHLRGKSFQIAALYPDGKREILLDVPRYDFNWQYTYDLAEPKLLPKGSKIICTAYYDNSKANRANPNPNATVRWGDQTWEEMQIGYYDHVPADQQPPKKMGATSPSKPVKIDSALEKAARQALTSNASFAAFAEAVRRVLPQVDRVCLSTQFDGKLNVEHVANFNPKAAHFLPQGFEGSSQAYALRRYALYGGAASNTDLSKKRAADLKHMASAFGSSFHSAIAVEGRPGSVNFWSQKTNAFSEDDRALLRALTQVTGMP